MRHVPFSASTKNGKDSSRMAAISATSAENSWFGGRQPQQRSEPTSCRFGMVYNGHGGAVGGGSGSGGGSDDSGIVNIIDDNEVVGDDDDGHGLGRLGLDRRRGSNENDLVRRGSAIRTRIGVGDSSKVVVSRSGLQYHREDELFFDDEDVEDEYEDDYERSSDEEYGRRLLLTALSAAAVVPSSLSRRGDIAFEKWPLYHKKSYLFKRRRRPSLSNVVEIYENCVDDDKCSVAAAATALLTKTPTTTSTSAAANVPTTLENGGVASSGSGATLVADTRRDRDVLTSSGVLCAGVCGVGSASSVANRKPSTLADNPSTISTTDPASQPRSSTGPGSRLFGSASDLRVQPTFKELPSGVTSTSNGNGAIPAAIHKARRSSLSKSWYGEPCSVSEKSPFNGSCCGAADKDSGSYTVWRRRRTFTSVPEDEDAAIGEIGVDGEERVVLLERSVSVPNDGALSTPTACASATMVSTKSAGCCDYTTMSSPAAATAANGASKLGKWSRSKIDLLLPSLKSLVTMTTNKLSASRSSNLNCRGNSSCVTNNYSTSRFDVRTIGSPLAATLRRNISLNSVQTTRKNSSSDNLVEVCLLNKKLRKCNTVLTLSGCISKNPNAHGTLNVEPLRPVNRLRVAPNSQDVFPVSRMCSRCSSLLSMASSSRYSLNSAHDFVPVVSPSVLCKVCLNEVPLKDSWTLQHCECSYCVDVSSIQSVFFRF
ncbi:RBR-type E3 ubiquitin transferase [Sarracenia purpurea var. burkii]